MSVFSALDIRRVFPRPADLPLDLELEYIEAARDGDDEAFTILARQYASALLRAVSNSGTYKDRDELESAALLGFAEAVRDCKPGYRLSSIIRPYVSKAVFEVSGSYMALHIPPRTLVRFTSAVRKAREDLADDADQDHVLARAEAIASAAGMTVETFRAVRDARYSRSSNVFAECGIDPTGFEDAGLSVVESDYALARTALDSLAPQEREVVALAYGFSDYLALSDGEIAERLGMSRSKVQRVRVAALEKMRDALGLDEDELAA